MSELNFRIIIVPKTPYSAEDKRNLLSDVERKITNCQLDVLSIKFFAKSSEEDDHPEIQELILQVLAKSTSSDTEEKCRKYTDFCFRWKEQSKSLPCSYVELYSSDFFLYSRPASRNEISCQELRFGVLPHDGCFHDYASASVDVIHFYHDTRNVIIRYKNFELLFSYDNIKNVFINIKPQPFEIFFDLFNPPVIHKLEDSHNPKVGKFVLRHRCLTMRQHGESEIPVDVLGRSNVLCLSVIIPEATLNKIISNIHYRCCEKPVYYSAISTVTRDVPPDPIISDFNFGCLYLITAICKRSFTFTVQTRNTSRRLRKLASFGRENPRSLEKALTDVLLAVDSGKIVNYWNAIESRYAHYRSKKDVLDFKQCLVPSNCYMIRRITLTPTRQLFWPPEILVGNRVVRNFESEYAIRVSYRDDNLKKLSSVATFADKGFLNSCIKNPTNFGIRIGHRHYKFLAWSNSQIRDHGVWMYAKDLKGRTSEYIRQWMGDFSHIRNVPKYMARMGQCFSQTEDALSVPLNPTSVRTEPDVEGGYDPNNCKPYCFSDGIGRISTKLAAQVHASLKHDKLCSAFQIRYGGYKGMLVVDPTLEDVDIVFRKSMKKFECPNSTRLEIARTSAPSRLKLNRPFIAILSDLAIRHRVFLRLQENMLKNLTDMLFDEERAVDCLKSHTPSDLFKYKDVSLSGIHLTTEPFFRTILLALHRHQIGCLKSKASVAIDPNFGRNMLGVMDETGTLNYGEVFVQYSNDITHGETMRETTVLTGEVLVTKNPCHYPGDVRKFGAVNVPCLHHIVDCIVFPRRGPRPHPNEMAGSDLDGDEYAVLWAPDLMFYGPNMKPAHFEDAKSKIVPCVTVPDMINCLQEYISKDQVGQISHAHLALADQFGVDDPLCLSVAKKISVAVDFAKTGECCHLETYEKPTQFPDFMEKNDRLEYKSQKALGKMYRICRDFETENKETTIMYKDVKVDPHLVYPGWEHYKEEAMKARSKYNSLVGSLLRNYGIEHESEALSGAFSKLHCRFHERNDRMDIQKVILLCLKKLMKDTMEEFLEDIAYNVDAVEMYKKLLQKASAYYVVTYSDPDAKFLSFPWSVSKYLANIKVYFSTPSPFSPAITKLDEKILECYYKNLLPEYEETCIWSQYEMLCDPQIIQRSLRALILWAQDEEIIETPDRRQGLLYMDTFIKLFLHVAKLFKYLGRKNDCDDNGNSDVPPKRNITQFSSGKFCLDFLKFCSSLRFYNKSEIISVLPFDVYKYSKLAKRAVVSYHRFALSGIFRNLYFDRKIKEDMIEMNPVAVDTKVFAQAAIISESVLRKAEEALVTHSKVDWISLREHQQTKKVWISARGSERALKDLKMLLRKKHDVLSQLVSAPNENGGRPCVGTKRPAKQYSVEAKRVKVESDT